MSPKQRQFIEDLLKDRVVPAFESERISNMLAIWENIPGAEASTAIDSLLGYPKRTIQRDPVQQPAVQKGFYALQFAGEDKMRFFKVDTPTQGRWAGFTFLAELHGPNHEPIKDRTRKAEILKAINLDPIGAMGTFGQHLGRCGNCRKRLTDEVSRAAGIGPECRRQLGIKVDRAEILAQVQQEQREEVSFPHTPETGPEDFVPQKPDIVVDRPGPFALYVNREHVREFNRADDAVQAAWANFRRPDVSQAAVVDAHADLVMELDY